jgi:phosphate:Na+ symporter
LGVLAGTVLTAIIQSSSASVGILQALASTGQVSYGAAIPIIMGQNIGTCVTALLSSVGANKNARRAAVVHLLFNIIGTAVWLSVFCFIRIVAAPVVLSQSASMFGIAVAHSIFNILCTALLLPLSSVLEKLALRIVPEDANGSNTDTLLDDRLLMTPPLALGRCHELVGVMAERAWKALSLSLSQLDHYDAQEARQIRENEDETDRYEDEIGTYLIKLSSKSLNQEDSEETTALLKYIGDFERIADHAVDILMSAEEMRDKRLHFSQQAMQEMAVLRQAIHEIMELAVDAFRYNDMGKAIYVEPLEQVIDTLKEEMRTRHIFRMKQETCSVEVGFVWSDLLTSLERVSDHCSNIAGCVIDIAQNNLNLHESLKRTQTNDAFYREAYQQYSQKYALPLSR